MKESLHFSKLTIHRCEILLLVHSPKTVIDCQTLCFYPGIFLIVSVIPTFCWEWFLTKLGLGLVKKQVAWYWARLTMYSSHPGWASWSLGGSLTSVHGSWGSWEGFLRNIQAPSRKYWFAIQKDSVKVSKPGRGFLSKWSLDYHFLSLIW